MMAAGGADGTDELRIDDVESADLSLRIELLRTRGELDQIHESLRGAADPGTGGADVGGGLPSLLPTLSGLLTDSSELARLKASRRYRLASLIAEVLARPLGMLGKARRSARSSVLSARRAVGRVRRGVQAATVAADQVAAAGGDPVEVEIHALPVSSAGPLQATEFRVAAVLDPFSAASFGPECALRLLTPSAWAEEIRQHKPHLLLVESAWTGLEGEWSGQVERAPAVLRSLVMSCRDAGIPTVFWNKEDPLHFGAFLETARLFDHVLTTDVDCVPRYRRLLGHDRVGVMPFGVQPAIHHPIGAVPRNPSSVFAGAWYGRLGDRCRDFIRSADALALAGDLVIHDRNDGQGAGYQRFPAKYSAHLHPAVPYAETGTVFRRHVIGLNLNTIKDSPTMFARRAIELAACGTSVYSNHSLALYVLLGGGAVISDNAERLLRESWGELRQPLARRYRVRRLQALRAVLREHTWAHRTRALARQVLGVELPHLSGTVYVLARVASAAQLASICAAFQRQSLQGAKLVLDAPGTLVLPEHALPLATVEFSPDDWVALFHPEDYYGPHYLVDLMAASQWGLGEMIGKAAWHEWTGQRVVEHHQASEYSRVGSLALRRSVFRVAAVSASPAGLLDSIEAGSLTGACISTDAWEYLQGGADAEDRASVAVRCLANATMEEINLAVARFPPQPDPGATGANAIDGPTLVGLFAGGLAHERVSVARVEGRMELCSRLQGDEVATIATRPLPLAMVEVDGEIRVSLQAPRMSPFRVYLEFLGPRDQILHRAPLHPSASVEIPGHAHAVSCRFAFDATGPAVQEIDGIWLDGVLPEPAFIAGSGRLAVVTNAYPKPGSLYRNGFVHRRVLAYLERGIGVDVFVVRQDGPTGHYEFEGVLVREIQPASLRKTLGAADHLAVAVHFLSPVIWEALQEVLGSKQVTVWLHGAEIQSWKHRSFNHRDDREREAARREGEQRSRFWATVFTAAWPRLHFVFVSEYFARQTWQDLGVQPSDSAWSVIHNPIDTELFKYRDKPPSLAKKILSIRPHASRIYANDLVAETIHRLAKLELFPQLSFTLVGDGERWEQDFSGLDRYPNVTLIRRFLTQPEIASLHRTHGVFLVPTRGDTQGVSRDEAMASGLVPVTTNIAAVPEFADPCCAELCGPEDADALAAAVARLASDGGRFQSMSRQASGRVARQSGSSIIIDKELFALGLGSASHLDCCARIASLTQAH